MPFTRDEISKQISDRLHLLANMLKTRSRARHTDANRSLETVMQQFFNALYGWNLVNLNAAQEDFPAADLGDRKRRVAIQITNEKSGAKITKTGETAQRNGFGKDFRRLIIFFLLERKPGTPKSFRQPAGGPEIECQDITDLLKAIREMEVEALKRAATVLANEIGGTFSPEPLAIYFKALRENFSTYENLGLPPPANADGETDRPIAICDLFVHPTCTSAHMSPEEFDSALLAGKNPATPLLPLLADYGASSETERRTVILADPGMGKSTLIQWLIVTLASKDPLPPDADGLRGAIPLPFILRDLVHHLPEDAKDWDWPSLLDAFRKYHPRAAGRQPLAAAIMADEAAFDTLLDSERAFFLIDGLDEISDFARRHALRHALWAGFNRHYNARWLMTSRVVGYDKMAVHSEFFEVGKALPVTPRNEVNFDWALRLGWSHERAEFVEEVRFQEGSGAHRKFARVLYLAPFNNAQQSTFIRNWYLPRLGKARGEERAIGFVKAVRQHPSVCVIGRVPNLLYLLALLYRHKAHLPNGRALVYAAISDAYLEGIDLDRHLSGHEPASYKLSDKIRILAAVARHVQKRRAAVKDQKQATEILITRPELEEWLAPHFPGEDGCATLHAFIGYVAARSGLLLPRGEGLFGFAHLSFQEYYAACWLEDEFRRLLNAQASGGGGGFLRRRVASTSAGSLTREDFGKFAAFLPWREPLVFLVEKVSANPDDAATLIEWLFPQFARLSVPAEGGDRPELMPVEAAWLLASLSLDPQVALSPEQRQDVWSALWRAHLNQQEPKKNWHLAPALLSGSEFEPDVFASLIQLNPAILNLSSCAGVSDLTPLARLTQLQHLDLRMCTGVIDLAPLAVFTQLRSLKLGGCAEISDLTPLAKLTQLQYLDLGACVGVSNLVPLARLTRLRSLNLSGCAKVDNLAPLAELTHLESVYLRKCIRVCDLAPLGKFTRLRHLDLMDCTGVDDLTPLTGLTHSYLIQLAGCVSLSKKLVRTFKSSHPDVMIFFP